MTEEAKPRLHSLPRLLPRLEPPKERPPLADLAGRYDSELHALDGTQVEIATGPCEETKRLSRSQSDTSVQHSLREGRVALDQRCREVNELIAQVHEARRRTDLALQIPSGPREDLDYGVLETVSTPSAQAYKHTSVRASGGVDFRCSAVCSQEDKQTRFPVWRHLRAPCLIFDVRQVTPSAPRLYSPSRGVISI